MAAGTNAVAAPAALVSCRVLEYASHGTGYFLRGDGDAPRPQAARGETWAGAGALAN